MRVKPDNLLIGQQFHSSLTALVMIFFLQNVNIFQFHQKSVLVHPSAEDVDAFEDGTMEDDR